MVAFMDESMRQGSPSLYVLAAVEVAAQDAGKVRSGLRALLLPRQRRLHWREESPARQRSILDAIQSMPVEAIIVELRDSIRPERARALCLRRALWELHVRQLDELVIETRQQHNDQRDRRTILAAKKNGEASDLLAYSFGKPLSEPLLWLPDAIAGARSSGLTLSASAKNVVDLSHEH
jgi:hypothetical protein